MLIPLHLLFLVLTCHGVTMIPASTSVLDIKYSVYYLQAYSLPLCPCTGAYLPGGAHGWGVILGNSDWVHLEILLVERVNMKGFLILFFLELKAWILRGKTSHESFTSRIPGNRKNTSDSCGRAEEDLSPEGHRQNGIHLIQEAQEQREMGPEGQSSTFHSENLSTTR